MDFSIATFGGCHAADITAAPFALLIGSGGQGKTSILRGVAAALTGQVVPQGMTKAKTLSLVTDGAAHGSIRASGDTWGTMITWPACDYQTTGHPPAVSAIAAGLTDYCALSPKDRAALLAPLIKSEPTEKDLSNALFAFAFPTSGVATTDEVEACKALDLNPMAAYHVAVYRETRRLWGQIRADGWDSAHKAAAKAATDAKAIWRHITGETYGASKADSWNPEGWHDGLTAPDATSAAHDRLTRAKAARDSALTGAAIAAHDLDKTRAKAAEPLEDEAAAQDTYRAAQDAVDQAQAAYDALAPLPVGATSTPCPHCGGAVTLTATAVGAAEYQLGITAHLPGQNIGRSGRRYGRKYHYYTGCQQVQLPQPGQRKRQQRQKQKLDQTGRDQCPAAATQGPQVQSGSHRQQPHWQRHTPQQLQHRSYTQRQSSARKAQRNTQQTSQNQRISSQCHQQLTRRKRLLGSQCKSQDAEQVQQRNHHGRYHRRQHDAL